MGTISEVKPTKRVKIFYIFLSLVLIALILTQCGFGSNNPIVDMMCPLNQPGTKWVSDDGSITFFVEKEETVYYDITNAPVLSEIAANPIERNSKKIVARMHGTIVTEAETYEFFAFWAADYWFDLYSTTISEIQNEGKHFYQEVAHDYMIVSFGTYSLSMSKFEATVDEAVYGDLFDEGQKIIFTRCSK